MSQQTLGGFGFFSPSRSHSAKRKLEVESDSESSQTPKKKFRKNLNQDSFDWYICDENGLWHCSVCREYKVDNTYARGHERPGKTTNHKRHAESGSHKSSVTRQNMKDKEALPSQVNRIVTKDTDTITTYMKCAYHQAKHELPKAAFKPLLELADNLNVDLLRDKSCELMYSSDSSLNEFHQAISDVIWDENYSGILKSQKYGLMIDESTDIGNKKQLLAYIQYLDQDGVKCVLLENMIITTPKADSSTIVEKITECLKRKNIDISDMVGIGTDGASVMTGRKNGVVQKLKEYSPSLIGVHCAAHRCALATSQASNSIPELAAFSRTVTNIFYYFSNYALRSNKLAEIQAIMQLPTLKFTNIHSVRWLSLQHAVEVIYRTYPALVTALEHEATNNSVAKGLLHEVEQYKFVGFTHMLMDILPFIGRLSKLFQTNIIDFSKIRPSVDATCDSLLDLIEAQGVYMDKLSEFVNTCACNYVRPMSESKASLVKKNVSENIDGFDGFHDHDNDQDDDESYDLLNVEHTTSLRYIDIQKKLVSSIFEQYLNNIVDNLRSRFNDLGRLELLSVLDPGVIRKNESCLATFGNNEIVSVGSHFKLDCDKLRSEYSTYKRLVIGSCKDINLHEVALKIIKEQECLMPNICNCLKICCVIPVSSVSCERGFSTQNRIKSKLRTNLNNETLNRLMRISEEGPALKEFDFGKAIQIWRQKTRRF